MSIVFILWEISRKHKRFLFYVGIFPQTPRKQYLKTEKPCRWPLSINGYNEEAFFEHNTSCSRTEHWLKNSTFISAQLIYSSETYLFLKLSTVGSTILSYPWVVCECWKILSEKSIDTFVLELGAINFSKESRNKEENNLEMESSCMIREHGQHVTLIYVLLRAFRKGMFVCTGGFMVLYVTVPIKIRRTSACKTYVLILNNSKHVWNETHCNQ